MREPLSHYMRVGIVQFVAYPCLTGDGPILESIRSICSDPFFDAIEISWMKDAAVRAQAKEMLRTSGMTVLYCAHPWLLTGNLDLNAEDERQRRSAVEAVKLAVADAHDFGVADLALLSGSYPGAGKRAQAMDLLQDALVEICQYADRRGIRILLELFDQEVDKKRLIGKAADAEEMAGRVARQCGNFGLLADLSHLPMLGETPEEALDRMKDYVKHVHIGNCYLQNRDDPAWGDEHPRFGYPGSEIDVEEIARFLTALFDIGYLKREPRERPFLSFEIKPVGGEEPGLVIANAKRKLTEAWLHV